MGRKRTYKALSVAAGPSMKGCKTRKLTSEILKEAYAQRIEVEDEEITKTIPMSAFFKQAVSGSEDFIDDDVNEQSDEFQREVDNQDVASEKDNKLLDAFFHKDGASIAQRLCDTVTSFKEFEDKDVATGSACLSETIAIDYYQSLGKFMSLYTHGKMPQALSHATRQENWVPLLKYSQPELWSPSAMYKATNMFASSSQSERFYELFLLPRVRQDIRTQKKLHFFLYQSLKKALFRPQEFCCGILFPLCKSGTCTNEEAVIIGSVMQKVSIPQKFSCFALLCLAGMKFLGTTSYFIKVILEKKYALAHGAIDAVAAHFLRTHKESSVIMPVIWHQTLLSFVQLYKHELRKEDKKSLSSLLEMQIHKPITPEILRELESSRNRGENEITISHSASTNNNKAIKEDLFDMPQVPMEED